MPPETKDKLATVKTLIAENRAEEAWSALKACVKPDDDFSLQHRYFKLFSKMPCERLGLLPVRVAFLASSTVDHFIEAFQFWMAVEGYSAQIFNNPFNTLEQTAADPGSALYAFKPDFIWIFTGYRDLDLAVRSGGSEALVREKIQENVERFTRLWQSIRQNSSAIILQNNADAPLVRPFGNLDGQAPWGCTNLYRQFNVALGMAADAGVVVLDIDHLSSEYGKARWCDERYWYHSKHAFALDASGFAAHQAACTIRACKGQAKKALVLDLDNTLWGGIIGDDGLDGLRLGHGTEGEAYVDFQRYVLALKNRGVILAICSKNEEENARLPFLKHPDMRIKLDDVAVFQANWDNKADNIREIARILNIGLDALVFVDDNPAERELIRQVLPMVAVPEMPQDPAEYIRALDCKKYFEMTAFSAEDAGRSTMYRENAQRAILQRQATNLDDYLQALNMQAISHTFDDFHLPRIAQLINKSNQFHLTTTRYSEAQIREIMKNPEYVCRYFKLKDRFGDNGLICVLILKKKDARILTVDTWVMSCRVLTRGMEEFVHNEIVKIARDLGLLMVEGCYLPTQKNGLVKTLYQKLDYELAEETATLSRWTLAISDDAVLRKTFIKPVSAY